MSTTETGNDTTEGAAPSSPGAPALPARARRAAGSNAGAAAVNLLSPWVMDELRVRKLRSQFVLGLVLLIVVIGAAWTFLRLQVSSAEDTLASEQSRIAAVQEDLNALGPVQTYSTTIEGKAVLVDATMAGQVGFEDVLEALDQARPESATIDTITVNLPDTSATGAATDPAATTVCPGPDPFGATVVIGCIQVAGTAETRQDVSDLVIQLSRSPLFAEPFVSTTLRGDANQVTFSGTIGLTPEALSGRYDDLAVTLGLMPAPAEAPAAPVEETP